MPDWIYRIMPLWLYKALRRRDARRTEAQRAAHDGEIRRLLGEALAGTAREDKLRSLKERHPDWVDVASRTSEAEAMKEMLLRDIDGLHDCEAWTLVRLQPRLGGTAQAVAALPGLLARLDVEPWEDNLGSISGAIRLLGAMEHPSAAKPLAAFYVKTSLAFGPAEQIEINDLAGGALGAISPRSRAVAQLLARGDAWTTKVEAVRYLANQRGDDVDEALRTAISDPHPEVRAAARDVMPRA